MDWLERMNGALRYIEENLTNDIDDQEIARIACCSEYHFKRMFSFIAGVTLSEYIRRRRLTLAAFDLKYPHAKVIDVAVKYGYNSPDAFARAFRSLHGITPTATRKQGHLLKAYPPITFQLSIKGGTAMNYRIEEKDAFQVVGIKKRVKLISGGVNPEIAQVWENISEETLSQIETISNQEPSGLLNICANFSDEGAEQGELDYYIAAATNLACPSNLTKLEIPAFTWAVFEAEGEWSEVQEVWGRIYSEWFPTSDYEHGGGPEILSSRDHRSEIWIPVVSP